MVSLQQQQKFSHHFKCIQLRDRIAIAQTHTNIMENASQRNKFVIFASSCMFAEVFLVSFSAVHVQRKTANTVYAN